MFIFRDCLRLFLTDCWNLLCFLRHVHIFACKLKHMMSRCSSFHMSVLFNHNHSWMIFGNLWPTVLLQNSSCRMLKRSTDFTDPCSRVRFLPSPSFLFKISLQVKTIVFFCFCKQMQNNAICFLQVAKVEFFFCFLHIRNWHTRSSHKIQSRHLSVVWKWQRLRQRLSTTGSYSGSFQTEKTLYHFARLSWSGSKYW